MGTYSFVLIQHNCRSPDPGTLIVNTDIAFAGNKIGIGILVHIHLQILLLSKAIPRTGRFLVDFGELNGLLKDM